MTNRQAPGSPAGPNIPHCNDARLLEQAEDLAGPIEAAMLYGSRARGNATMQSDVDVLAIVRDNPGSVSEGALVITAYRAGHLRTLADRGSLFVLHLVRDGRILHDPAGELAGILAAYRSPADPDRLGVELAAAASGLLAATAEERRAHGPAMRNLAYYVIRTAIYDRCAKRGKPEFDSVAAAAALGLEKLAPLIAARRDAYTDDSLTRVLAALPAVLPHSGFPALHGLAAAAVRAAFDRPLASDLLTGVLIGDAVDYTALTLPPA
jgi:Polymerase beta, Nucleotidyltransferase